MQMYTQKIKECDHAFDCDCVDLAEQGNYLLLPKKFLMYKQSLIKKTNKLEMDYYVPKDFFRNILVRFKSQNKPVDFFCVVYPNGRVEQWDIKSAKFEKKINERTRKVEPIFIIRLHSRERQTIHLKKVGVPKDTFYESFSTIS